MAEPDRRSNAKAAAFIGAAAVVAVVFVGLTIGSKVSRGEPWWPWLLLPLATGAIAGVAVLMTQRAGARPTTMRWALGVGAAGLALVGLSIFLVAGSS
nr:hypothetical protein [Propionicimonas sp.]